MLSVQTNVSAISAQRHLGATSNALGTAMERLSSGFRINRAADDAAGLAVSEKLKAQIGGLNQAARNAQDGISMIQTAEGALDEVQSMMQRMRDLAVQAASDTNSQTERDNINLELSQLKDEINSISVRTKFNGQSLLNGSLVTQQNSTVAGSVLVGAGIGTNGAGAVVGVDVSAAQAGTTYRFSSDTTADTVTLNMSVNGVTTSDTVSLSALTAGQTETLSFAKLGVKVTIAASGNLSQDEIGTTFGTNSVIATSSSAGSATLQTGANKGDETTVAFVNTQLTGSTGVAEMDNLATALGTFNTDRSRTNASELIDRLDTALGALSSSRATLGAAQNRLQHTIANLGTTAENLSASNSRIRDVDVATESSNMAKNQVLEQAGVSVLAQANQMPQLALKLLG